MPAPLRAARIAVFRELLHKLVDDLLDTLGVAERLADQAAPHNLTRETRQAKPAITLTPPGKKPGKRRAGKGAGRPILGEVLVGVIARNAKRTRELVVTIPAKLLPRIGLTTPCDCGLVLEAGVIRIGAGSKARAVTTLAGRRAKISAGSRALGWKPEAHLSEACGWRIDHQSVLVVDRPAWLVAGKPLDDGKLAGGRAKAAHIMTKKMQHAAAAPTARASTRAPHCDVCQELKPRKELYECPKCAVLVCRPETSKCFDSHVRREHHSKATGRAPVPKGVEVRA